MTVAIARVLTERDYGAWTQLGGLFLVLSMPGSALVVAVVRRVVAWEREGRSRRVDDWAAALHRRGLAALGAFAVVAVASRWVLADFLSLPGPGGVAEILVAGGAWALLSLDRGLLQGRHQYRPLAANLILEAGCRSVFAVGLSAAGLDVQGVTIGVLLGIVVADVHARRFLHHEVAAAEPAPAVVDAHEGRRDLTRDLATALGALALLALLQSLDVIVLGREAPSRSGDYAAISVASKALVFVAIVLGGFLLPEAAARYHRGERATRQLGAAVGILAVPAGVLVVLALAVPRLLLRLVFGEDLDDAAPAFATLALAMAALATNVLLTNYLLAIGRRRVVVALAVAAVAAAVALTAADGRPVETARANLACEAALLVVIGVMVRRAPVGAAR